jgi:hypothetical protein
VSEHTVRETAAAAEPAVDSFFQWTVAGNVMVAYGSIRSPHFPERHVLGFLRLLLTDISGRPEMLLPFPDLRFYSIGFPSDAGGPRPVCGRAVRQGRYLA